MRNPNDSTRRFPFPASLAWLPLIGLCLALTACTATPEEKKAKHMERGNKYFDQGKFNEAAIEYKNVIQADPKDAVAHHKLAQTYLALGGLTNQIGRAHV